MNNDLISREALKKILEELAKDKFDSLYGDGIRRAIKEIDNAPTVESDIEVIAKDAYKQGYTDGWKERFGEPEERPQGECRTCIHRDPEDKKCDCGGQERLGCPFPVSDDYYCKYYEKGGAE